jgi:hypothetical protein
MPSPSSGRTVILALAYAAAAWSAFTGVLVAAGNMLLPELTRPSAPLVVVALCAVTAAAVALITMDYQRRAGRFDPAAALVLGTTLAAVGLTLDGVLLLATRFRYPRLDEAKTATLATLLLLAYAVAAVVPPCVALRRARPRSALVARQ